MKTRILHTKIWKDSYFCELSATEKLIFLYLLSNENINMCGTYELNDKEISMWVGIPMGELQAIKAKLERDGKFRFANGWVSVVNHSRYNNYGNGEKQEEALRRELLLIPETLLRKECDTSIDTSIHTTPILDIIHNTEYITEGEYEGKQKTTSTLNQPATPTTPAKKNKPTDLEYSEILSDIRELFKSKFHVAPTVFGGSYPTHCKTLINKLNSMSMEKSQALLTRTQLAQFFNAYFDWLLSKPFGSDISSFSVVEKYLDKFLFERNGNRN